MVDASSIEVNRRKKRAKTDRLDAEKLAGQLIRHWRGERVWSIESKFRVRLGPIGILAFQALLPGGRLLAQLAQIARTYAGPEFDFDVQLVLRREETPFCRLGAGEFSGPRLGWNTWACSVVRSRDADEAVFAADGAPSR